MRSLTVRRINISVWLRVLGVALFAVGTGVSARISVALPFSPVPITLQVLAVVLTGYVLGPRDGFIAQALYLKAILLGAPWTTGGLSGPAAFMAPTGGYLLAFPLAAALAGWLAHHPGYPRGLAESHPRVSWWEVSAPLSWFSNRKVVRPSLKGIRPAPSVAERATNGPRAGVLGRIPRPLWRALGGMSALAVIYALGMGWLSVYVGGQGDAWRLGVVPFVGVDALKVTIAVAALSLRDR